ncbi:MAG: cyclic lactone autoinducer peptide [Provencibacterium sp.]|jgi:cyclic lactone autoinducer peptide|nr:cyclic lactone autoinducer peptide [Provencibacterium sp.]
MLKLVAKAVKAMATLGANTASLFGSYQPKTPSALLKK